MDTILDPNNAISFRTTYSMIKPYNPHVIVGSKEAIFNVLTHVQRDEDAHKVSDIVQFF